MTDHELIRTTLAQYCRLADDGDFTAFAQLFAADGVFVAGGTEHRGREAIIAFMGAALGDPERRGKHVTTNTIIELEGDQGRAWSDYVMVGRNLSIASAGRYDDTLVRRGGSWLFARRELSRMG